MKQKRQILSEQNKTIQKKKKRYIGWLCEHFHETLMILKKKATQKTEIFEKKKVAVRFSLITFCAYVDYFIVCYKVEKH